LTKHSLSILYKKKREADFLSPEEQDWFLNSFEQASSTSWQMSGRLFWSVVFMNKLSSDDRKFLQAIFEGESIFPEAKSLLVTALTFSTLRYFDEEKLALHLDLYERSDQSQLVRQRCLTGLLLALYQHDSRMAFYPGTLTRLELLAGNPSFFRNAGQIMLQLLSSRETEKITRRIQEEIIPEMIRISPNIRNKLNFESLMDEGASDDRNPDWQELFNESPGLLGKMEELTKMQTEGADVFLSSFYALKGFPFFNEFTNWFMPFYAGHPDVRLVTSQDDQGINASISGSLLNAPFLCNSDKYSFLFMLQNIAGETRQMMESILKQQMEQLEEIRKEDEVLEPGKEDMIVSNQYIQDLYRFFRLHPSRKDFEDLFSWKFDFYNKRVFGSFFDQGAELINKTAAFFFEKGYFPEALEIYGRFKDQDAEHLQKEAYCYQKLGNFEKALSLYRKAELFDVNKIWNLKKIALCYRNLKLPEEALKVYQAIESREPENLNIIYAIGYCFSETGRYQDALNCFFKIEYLSPGNKKVWKPIAWCSFLTGKKEQAVKYYRKLMDDQPDKYDLMNMGHVQWSLDKRDSALDYYRQSLTAGGFSKNEFLTAFDEDLPFLVAQGIPDEEVPIMLDQLWYFLDDYVSF